MEKGPIRYLPREIGFTAPVTTNIAAVGIFAADSLINKTDQYATAHVPTTQQVNEAALRAIQETNAIREQAGEEPLTQKEKRKLIDSEMDKATAHEDADYQVRNAEQVLSNMRHPGPNYAPEETRQTAIANAQDRLQAAKEAEIATDKAMLQSLRGH